METQQVRDRVKSELHRPETGKAGSAFLGLTPKTVFFVGLGLALLGPALLVLPTIWAPLDFSSTGQIGDTIGGITAPIVNLLGAYLVYVAFRAQVEANRLLQQQASEQKANRIEDNESTRLFQMYEHLVAAIDGFSFNGFNEEYLQNPGNTRSQHLRGANPQGSHAIYLMMDEIKCHYHGTEEQLEEDVAVAEFTAILRMFELITERLKHATGRDWPVLLQLTMHQFRYRVMVRFKDQTAEDLAKWHCSACRHDHGLPERMLMLFASIEKNLAELAKREGA